MLLEFAEKNYVTLLHVCVAVIYFYWKKFQQKNIVFCDNHENNQQISLFISQENLILQKQGANLSLNLNSKKIVPFISRY